MSLHGSIYFGKCTPDKGIMHSERCLHNSGVIGILLNINEQTAVPHKVH